MGFMGGGGGGGTYNYPAPDDGTAAIRAQAAIDNNRRQQDKLDALRAGYQQEMRDLNSYDSYYSQVDPTISRLMTGAQELVTGRGLNWDEFDDPIVSAIRSGIPQAGMTRDEVSANKANLNTFDISNLNTILPDYTAAPNSGSLTSLTADPFVTNTLNNIEGQRRTQYGNEFDTFAPTGFADTYTSGLRGNANSIADSILGSQYEEANNQLLAAHQRGNLSQQGLNTARTNLESQRTVGRSQLDTMINDILSGGAANFNSIANEGRTAASNYRLGQNFSVDPFKSKLTDAQTQFASGLEGSLRDRVGGQQFFDTPSIINNAGISQGVTSGSRPLFDQFASQQSDATKKRGLGTQGVF